MRFSLFIFVLILYSASLWAQEPDWVRGKSKDYPDDQFIIGVGSGDSRRDAESQARAHIAEVFRVEIKSTVSVNRTEALKKADGHVSSEIGEETRSRINIGLQKTLEGTEIADVWQDPNDAKFFALAVLDREKASVRLAEQIHELDSEIVRLKDEIDSATIKMDKLKLTLLRKSLMINRAELNSDYRIVSASGSGIDSPYSYEKESSDIIRFLQNDFIVGISGDGLGADIAAQTVTDRFTADGFTVIHLDKEKGKAVDLLVEVNCRLEPSSEPVDDWYYCRWHLELNAADANTGAIILSASKNGKSGQLSVMGSQDRAVYDMNKSIITLADQLLKKLTGTE